jgi:hypothetical protein
MEDVLKSEITMKEWFSEEVKDLIRKLTTKDPN